MQHNQCKFRNPTEMATFCAQLTREGIVFDTTYSGDEYIVTITNHDDNFEALLVNPNDVISARRDRGLNDDGRR